VNVQNIGRGIYAACELDDDFREENKALRVVVVGASFRAVDSAAIEVFIALHEKNLDAIWRGRFQNFRVDAARAHLHRHPDAGAADFQRAILADAAIKREHDADFVPAFFQRHGQAHRARRRARRCARAGPFHYWP